MKGGKLLIMGSKIRSISLSDDEDLFLSEYNLSPSSLIKEKIYEMKGFIKTIAEKKIENLSFELDNQCKIREKLEEEVHELKEELKNVLEKEKPEDEKR